MLIGTLAGLALLVTGCSNAGDSADTQTPSSATSQPSAMAASFGPAHSAVPASGADSFDAMAQDPVATAASNNPELSTLVIAVKKAGLVDTLNSAQGITVFAPTNDAFAAVPKPTWTRLLATPKDF